MTKVTQVKCIVPFTHLMINPYGYCYSCCSIWTKIGNVGKLTPSNSVMDIWNNERMQYIRKAVLEDKLVKVCNFDYCPLAIKSEYFHLKTLKKDDDPNFNHIIDQIMAGRTILENPPYTLEIANSGKCNLRCIMCESHDKFRKNDHSLDQKIFTQILPEILPKTSKLFLVGNGEVFFNQYSRKFLQSPDPGRYPSLRIQLLTNGTMFTPRLWETIRHNRYESISVSIDAASKETYEKIRKNGKWDILLQNLKFISELRRQNAFYWFTISFCVMKSNYMEMKDFVELGLALGCDKIVFQKIIGRADIRENINLTHNRRIFIEIANTLADPIFHRPEVDITIIQQYQRYLGKRATSWDDFRTQIKEKFLYIPLKISFWMTQYFSFFIHASEFFHQKRIPAGNRD